jgi:hypothetical protein
VLGIFPSFRDQLHGERSRFGDGTYPFTTAVTVNACVVTMLDEDGVTVRTGLDLGGTVTMTEVEH